MPCSRGPLLSLVALGLACFMMSLASLAQAPDPGAAGKGKAKGKAAAPADPAAGAAKGKGPAPEKTPEPIPEPQVLRLVRTKLYLVTNHGANVLFKVTPAGVIVVDTKLPGDNNFERLVDLIKGVTAQPVKGVYNTHHHQDHTGNNDKFLAMNIPVIGPDHLKASLANYSAAPKPAAPSVTYGSTHVTKLGGSEVRAFHYGPGHTGGDAVVLFPAEKLLAISDLVTVGRAPVLDYAGGASLLGWIKSLDEVLKLDWTLAVPGNGEPVERPFVETYRKSLQTLADRAKAAIAAGTTKSQLLGQIKTDDLGWTLQLDADRLTAFYAEMATAKP